MRAMSSYITMTDPGTGEVYVFRNNAGIEIIDTWKELTGTAEIRLPNYYGALERKIKTGFAVEVYLGYDGDLKLEFAGYVAERSAGSPITFKCEDEMWQLKQQEITQAWESTTLEEVIKYLVPDAVITYLPSITIAPMRIDRVTVAKALQELKKNYNLVIYYRGKKLHVGASYQERLGRVKYKFSSAIANANVGSLEYKREDDVRIKLKAISLQPDNTKIEIALGDTEGEARTLHFYDLTEAELRQQGEAEIEQLKYNGYRGALAAKGIPFVQHSMVAEVADDKYPERAGDYFVDEVVTTYDGSDGFSRNVMLGIVI